MEIKSTLEKYPGYIVLPDYFNPAQVFAIQDAQFDARDYWKDNTVKTGKMVKDEEGNDTEAEEMKAGDRFHYVRARMVYIPALLLCVKEWHLDNFPLSGSGAKYEQFPMTPAEDVSELIQWAWDEVVKVYNGASEIPLE